MVETEAKVSVEFVLNVLRQHENDFDRLLAELENLVDKITILSNKIELVMDPDYPRDRPKRDRR